jgi:8-oxo-dGTP pyrophosphatase MutT (NUDIX family)
LPEPHTEKVNVYDPSGRVVGEMPRDAAKGSGLAVGAVNLLLVNARGELLLQQRPSDKENGALWDKSVGGHVDAGEDFDAAARREAGEELFAEAGSPRVRLAEGHEAFARALADADLLRQLVIRRESLQLNLRDVRRTPEGSVRNVLYHVATYLGRSDIPIAGFRPAQDEIVGLRYAPPDEVDRLLLAGELAPNMAFLWLTHARALLSLPGVNTA